MLNRVSVPITTEDAQVLVATMTRAVDAVRALREPPAPVRKPTRLPADSAAKKPAKPAPPHAAPADTTRKPKPGA